MHRRRPGCSSKSPEAAPRQEPASTTAATPDCGAAPAVGRFDPSTDLLMANFDLKFGFEDLADAQDFANTFASK
ncbi:hypothetical protein [Pseudofrankia asymbiotica]|uniref:Uncharacterized protein n=1 Tax=Pseudofrankia asymbiotica TaxID=1834516 RepID=A0A1V2I2D0_9ACTN|nr:hypothetical protein [Pseudofrankia asymbiotica]ONH23894.1 hypothetical protein BL253_31700 [Pseudofrankia asymbiotica]